MHLLCIRLRAAPASRCLPFPGPRVVAASNGVVSSASSLQLCRHSQPVPDTQGRSLPSQITGSAAKGGSEGDGGSTQDLGQTVQAIIAASSSNLHLHLHCLLLLA